MERIVLFVVSLVLAGCAAMPLSTLLALSAFEKDDFIAMKPEQIRAKVQLDEPVRADVAKATLSLALQTA
ncbi:hypothetical protein [Rheinheimera sp.]|uniref:hypothetical protein n=1 Tax=Rheinheimera sp. TaxID=1869214 RepID=UPI00307EDA82